MKTLQLGFVILLSIAVPVAADAADGLIFPWCCKSTPDAQWGSSAQVPHQILSTPATQTAPVVVMPPKSAFAYGWFGSNPNSHANIQWTRHFGTSRNFTQWSAR